MPQGIGNPIFIVFGATLLSAIIFAIGLKLRTAHMIGGRITGGVLAILAVAPVLGAGAMLVVKHPPEQTTIAHSTPIADPNG